MGRVCGAPGPDPHELGHVPGLGFHAGRVPGWDFCIRLGLFFHGLGHTSGLVLELKR